MGALKLAGGRETNLASSRLILGMYEVDWIVAWAQHHRAHALRLLKVKSRYCNKLHLNFTTESA